MIFGVFEKRVRSPDAERLRAALALPLDAEGAARQLVQGGVGLAAASAPGTGNGPRPAADADAGLCAVCTGRVYEAGRLAAEIGMAAPGAEPDGLSRLVLELYRRDGPDFVRRLDGRFAFAVGDAREGSVVLGRDRLGIEPLYVAEDDARLAFASSIPALRRFGAASGALDLTAVGRILLFNYNPGHQTIFREVRRLRPAHLLIARKDGTRLERYWRLTFEPTLDASQDEVAEELRAQLRRAVRRRMDAEDTPAVFVSGGMDSSSVLGLVREAHAGPIETFSYRCRGASFDESHYARLMADSVEARHHLADYAAHDVLAMPELVREMNEPFCDVGINLATWILGRSAAGTASWVLTGDGGDELFGGHPIYEADKIARYVDPIPGPLKAPVLALCRALPDSDQKKNWSVKLKRFGESLAFPPALLSHRWRVYYRPEELRDEVLAPEAAAGLDLPGLTADVLAINAEQTGGNLLTRSLHSDYQTVLDFYLRRNDLIRRFGIETRYPLLDHELVEFCARIPTALKIRGWFDTKYILKVAMEGLLPHGIVHREDKLGHSIPLKNWIRDDPEVHEFVLDHLSEETVRQRGWFRPEFVGRLVDEHLAKRRNHSHRLWTLAVLEMWLRAHA